MDIEDKFQSTLFWLSYLKVVWKKVSREAATSVKTLRKHVRTMLFLIDEILAFIVSPENNF